MSAYAAWGPKYGRRFLHVTVNPDGSITGTMVGRDTGFPSSSYPDKVITIPAEVVKKRRIRVVTS